MQKIPLAMGLVVAVALVAAETATACTCVRVSPADKLREADGAAVARLVAVRPLDDGEGPIPGEGPISSADPTDFIYRTGRVLKGKPRLRRGRRLVVRSVRHEASCGLSGEIGRLTGQFLTRAHGLWHSGTCGEISAGQMRRLARGAASGREGGSGCT